MSKAILTCTFSRYFAPFLSIPTTQTEQSLSDMAPTPPITIFQPNPDLQIAFDSRTRNPIYALERIRPLQKQQNRQHRRPNFHEETLLPEIYRSRNSHYKNSGYDRGHMAPAADFGASTNDTFVLTNVCPQHSGLNRTLWAQLEGWVRRIAQQQNEPIYVVTGPLWLPVRWNEYQYPAIGQPPTLCAVPTHFYKVIVVMSNGKINKFACFVIPNTEPHAEKKLHDYLVRWSDLEAVIGMQLFPNYARECRQRADELTQELWELSSSNRLSQPLLVSGNLKTLKKGRVNDGLEHLCKTGECK